MASVSDIKNQALRELGVIQVGQSADAQDFNLIGEAYDSVYAILKQQGLATWSSTGTIPNEIRDQVVALVAMSKINEFSVSEKRYNRILPKAQVAIPSIKSLVSPANESQDDPVDY